MGLNSEDPIRFIQPLLESKSSARQTAFKHVRDAFSSLSAETKSIVADLKSRLKPTDKDVTVEYNVINDHEFDVKLAGDMLIFVMNTNISTLEESHEVMSDPYIEGIEVNRYFGQVWAITLWPNR